MNIGDTVELTRTNEIQSRMGLLPGMFLTISSAISFIDADRYIVGVPAPTAERWPPGAYVYATDGRGHHFLRTDQLRLVKEAE